MYKNKFFLDAFSKEPTKTKQTPRWEVEPLAVRIGQPFKDKTLRQVRRHGCAHRPRVVLGETQLHFAGAVGQVQEQL